MKEWQETSLGFIRERPDGTIERHPYKYVAHESFTFRAKYDDAGKCVAVEPCPRRAFAMIKSSDGEIVRTNVGFSLHAELNNTHPFGVVPSGYEVVEFPQDHAMNTDGISEYRFDRESMGIVKKTR